MEAEVEQKTSDACIALAKRLACGKGEWGGFFYLSRCHGYLKRKKERREERKVDEPVS